MRSTLLKFAVLLISCFAVAQNINIDTQVKGSKWPASGTDTGVANAYAVSVTLGPSLRPFSRIDFVAVHANTGVSTLSVNGGTAINIVKPPNLALAAGDISVGNLVEVIYDGTNFQCLTCGSSTLIGGSRLSNNDITLFDEFLSGNLSETLNWSTAINGGGGPTSTVHPSGSSGANNPGVVSIGAGATSTNWIYYVLGFGNTGGDYLNPQTGTFKYYWRVENHGGPANGTVRAGMVDDRGQASGPNGVYFSSSTAANGNSNWWCIQKAAGTATTADSGVSSVLGTFHTLEMDASATTTVAWKIDGASVCGGIAATNVPNLNLTVAMEATGTSAEIRADFFRLDITTTGR